MPPRLSCALYCFENLQSLSPLSCLEDSENICARSEHCQTLPFWSGLSRAINEYVDRFTLEDLAFHPEKF